MSFDTRRSNSASLNDVLAQVDRLSAKDRRTLLRSLRGDEIAEDIEWLHKVWGRVKLTDKEITAIVEEVRAEMHEKRKAVKARR